MTTAKCKTVRSKSEFPHIFYHPQPGLSQDMLYLFDKQFPFPKMPHCYDRVSLNEGYVPSIFHDPQGEGSY
jgi:hypothetical protein